MNAAARPFNKQEATFYFLFAALLLLALAVAGLLVWALTPPSRSVYVGVVSDYPPRDSPYRVEAGGQTLWLVNLGHQFIALEPRNITARTACMVVWVEANRRFEDPCSADYFALDGAHLPAGVGSEVVGLRRYAVAVRSGELWVNLSAVTPPPTPLPAIYLGRTTDFPPQDAPYFVAAGERWLYLVNTGEEFIVLNPRFTIGNWDCFVAWIPSNKRFEDPCSGAKHTLTGKWIEQGLQYFQFRDLPPKDLTRYPLTIRFDELWVDLRAATPDP
ncbi:MAG: hypothetical protein RMK99_00560 [Anaerolineales bacterium]|nr:hypothetical protein [Anaerolineales bacterium]